MDRRALAMFDFDGTLLPGDSIIAFVRFARAQSAMTRRGFAGACLYGALASLRLCTAARAKQKALAFLCRMPAGAADALCERFARQVLLPALYPAGLDALRRHAAAGDAVLLVTASPERYMRPLAALLPVAGLIATAIGPDGAITQNCRGEVKVKRVHEWLFASGIYADFAASHAYGNSAGDLPMLRLAGHPHLVNPARALRRRAPAMDALRWGRERNGVGDGTPGKQRGDTAGKAL